MNATTRCINEIVGHPWCWRNRAHRMFVSGCLCTRCSGCEVVRIQNREETISISRQREIKEAHGKPHKIKDNNEFQFESAAHTHTRLMNIRANLYLSAPCIAHTKRVSLSLFFPFCFFFFSFRASIRISHTDAKWVISCVRF